MGSMQIDRHPCNPSSVPTLITRGKTVRAFNGAPAPRFQEVNGLLQDDAYKLVEITTL
jgi:hypothetical protein